MTPKEKAKEFIRRFYSIGAIECKQCALIAVEEISQHCYQVMKPFWQEVKQEIEKL